MIHQMNKVIFEGCLIEDPQFNRTSTSNVLVSNFRILHKRKYLTSKNEPKEEKCFVNVVAWLKIAEVCKKQNLQRRDFVWIEGRLQSKIWTTKGGDRKETLEIMAESIRITKRQDNRQNYFKNNEETKDIEE